MMARLVVCARAPLQAALKVEPSGWSVKRQKMRRLPGNYLKKD
jgi:hypothetical protein